MNVPPREDDPPPAPPDASAAKKRKLSDDDEFVDDDDEDVNPGGRHEQPCRKTMPPPPPTSFQYIALWEEVRERRRSGVGADDGAGVNSRGGSSFDAGVQGKNVRPTNGDKGSNSNSSSRDFSGGVNVILTYEDPDNLRKWEEELALARHNVSTRDKIEECYRRAQEHQHAVEEPRRHLKAFWREAEQLLCDLDNLMVLPRLYSMLDNNAFWFRMSPELKYSKKLAWVLLRADADLPVPFQRMLWRDPDCPHRDDREILMASIDKDLDGRRLRIVWNRKLADDRELVLKCFEKCPGCLSGRNHQGLLKPYLKDMEALRAFAFAPDPTYYRTTGNAYRAGIEKHFSRELFKDPEFMADLILHTLRSKKDDRWAELILAKAFTRRHWAQGTSVGDTVPPTKPSANGLDGTLWDNVAFAIRVADGLALLPPETRQACPVTYAELTDRVRGHAKVALAFVKVDPSIVDSVPESLRDETAVWEELWTVVTDLDPLAIYHESLRAAPCKKLLASQELVLRLLQASVTPGDNVERLRDFTKFFPNFTSAIQQNREINMELVVHCATSSVAELQTLVAPEWIHSREFWTDLVVRKACPCNAWSLVPEWLAKDEGLLLTWARRSHACRPTDVDWLALAVASVPNLGLLSDRRVLLNWLPQLCRDNATAEALLRQVPQECLESSFWLELFGQLSPPHNLLSYIPETLRNDPGIVQAQLRCAANDDAVLADCFDALSPQLRGRFLAQVIRVIQNGDNAAFRRTWRRVSRKYNLYRFPEAALAILSKGGSIKDISSTQVESLAWRHDPEFLLKVAEVCRGTTSWECCPDALRRDKSFLLRMLKLEKVPVLCLDDDLKRDFEMKCALHLRQSVEEIRQYLDSGGEWHEVQRRVPEAQTGEFAREVRARLQLYVSLETFMAGVRSDPSTSGPVSLLGQDDDTMIDFKRRLVEYVGCPSREEAMDLRHLSNKLTLAGY